MKISISDIDKPHKNVEVSKITTITKEGDNKFLVSSSLKVPIKYLTTMTGEQKQNIRRVQIKLYNDYGEYYAEKDLTNDIRKHVTNLRYEGPLILSGVGKLLGAEVELQVAIRVINFS